MFGILNINKPPHITSRDAVNVVQRLVRPVKVGHAGTLDPLATGVLVICLGSATRLVPYVQRMRKSYRGTFQLGLESPTEDMLGRIVQHRDPVQPSRAELQSSLSPFVGLSQQMPPAFSALKVAGRRAYDLARRGETVMLEPREIEIHRLTLVEYEYPRFVLDIECGSGTYVRSLGRDVAARLGTTAVMSALERTAIGAIQIAQAVDLSKLTSANLGDHLLPASQAVVGLPTIIIHPDEHQRVRQGLVISPTVDRISSNDMESATAELAAIDSAGNLVAILVPRLGGWGASRNFSH